MINESREALQIGLDMEEALAETCREMSKVLRGAPLPGRPIFNHLEQGKGKLIRARALLACAMNENGSIGRDGIVLASAIEILHLATLVHDDVLDEAELRRGMQTVQEKFGRKAAVICGDYLLAAALKQAAGVSDSNRFSQDRLPNFVERICMGELMQYQNNRNFALAPRRYLSIINGKTAALFEAAFLAGAMLSEEDEGKRKRYQRIGHCLGMLFQLLDDCLDFNMEERDAGKSVRSDFEQGVVTLPLIYALSENQGLALRVKAGIADREEVAEAVAGGIEAAEQMAEKYFEKARRELACLGLFVKKEGAINGILENCHNSFKKGKS